MKKQWTKQDRIACITIFAICVITFVSFLSAMTLSYFFDTHTAENILTSGEVKISVSGGPNNDGQIQFPLVVMPNTQYSAIDDPNLKYTILNEGTSGTVYVMVKLDSTYSNIIMPTVNENWVTGEGEGGSTYLFYMGKLDIGQSITLCDYWQIGNYENSIDGRTVTYTITAKAIQTQGSALSNMILASQGGWQYAPQIFKDMAGV